MTRWLRLWPLVFELGRLDASTEDEYKFWRAYAWWRGWFTTAHPGRHADWWIVDDNLA